MKEKGGGGCVDGYVMGLSLVYKFVLLLLFWPGNSFNDVERCVCAGYDNGDIKLFDLRTMTVRWEGNVKNGVSYLMEGTYSSVDRVCNLHCTAFANQCKYLLVPLRSDLTQYAFKVL